MVFPLMSKISISEIEFYWVPLNLMGTVLNDTLPLRQTIMGDKSPKSTKKLAGQKKVKADKIERKKKAAEDAKRVIDPNKK